MTLHRNAWITRRNVHYVIDFYAYGGTFFTYKLRTISGRQPLPTIPSPSDSSLETSALLVLNTWKPALYSEIPVLLFPEDIMSTQTLTMLL